MCLITFFLEDFRMARVNWDCIMNEVALFELEDFAAGLTSRRNLERVVSFTPAASEVRHLMSRGVVGARQLARKAAKRRGSIVRSSKKNTKRERGFINSRHSSYRRWKEGLMPRAYIPTFSEVFFFSMEL